MEVPVPTSEQLAKAHETFERKETRYRDYWAAFHAVENSLQSGNLEAVASSLAAFLKSWNWNYYRFKPWKIPLLESEIRELITDHLEVIKAFRVRSLAMLTQADRSPVMHLFTAFEQKLAQVGTAKTLNILAPNFFPLWDNAIAYHYGVTTAAPGYFLFMCVVKEQVARMILADGLMPLKTLDEYNYCKYTGRWLS